LVHYFCRPNHIKVQYLKGIILFFSLFIPVVAQSQTKTLEYLTIRDGLSQGMVYDICPTKDGFLWVATKDGLNRYDGYNFKVFSNNPFDPYSVGENTITALFEDSRELLWVGKETKGVDVFDKKKNRFHHFPLDIVRVSTTISVDVRGIQEGPDGSIWVMKMGVGVVRIKLPEQWKNGLPEQPDLESQVTVTPYILPTLKGPVNEALMDFVVLPNNRIIVATNLAEYEVNPETGGINRINDPLYTTYALRASVRKYSAQGSVVINLNEVRQMHEGQLKVTPLPPGTKLVRVGLYPGPGNAVWLAINKHLWLLDPGENIDFKHPDIVTDENTSSMSYDANGNIWIGTHGYGLRKVNMAKKRFNACAAGNSIIGVWRDPQGRYFGKTHEDIMQYLPETDELLPNSPLIKVPRSQIQMIFPSDGNTWIVCSDRSNNQEKGALHLFSPDRSVHRQFSFEAHLTYYDPSILVSRDRILISSKNCQLTRFDIATEKFEYFSYASSFQQKPEGVQTRALAEGPDGTLWVGTQLGLLKGIPNGNNYDFQLITANPGNPKGLNSNVISCILPDPQSPLEWLWIGTKGGGINLMHIPTGECRHFTTADRNGLPNNVVYGILPDNQGTFWCSTNRGLANLIPKKGGSVHEYEVKVYTADMGVQSDEFNTGGFSKAPDGELLFGGVNGINHFYPEKLKSQSNNARVLVVGLEINHVSAQLGEPGSPLKQPLEMTKELHLDYDQNNVSFEFALLDFTAPSLNKFRYQLVGLDQDWVESQGQRFAHFNHLQPGTYRLQVQGKTSEGEWMDTAFPLTIIVHPPWYRSWLAWLVYISFLVWAGWQMYQFQIRRVKLQEQLIYEQREAERARVLEQLKTNFFNNITHEFRTPLTLMLEPARRILSTAQDPSIRQNAQLIEKNSNRLLLMVNQLLDMAKLEGGSMSVELTYGSLADTMGDVYQSFLPMAEQKGIHLRLDMPKMLIQCQFDKAKVEHILNNLLSNALKFTPENGSVHLICAISPANDGPAQVEITVKDTGRGISPAALPKIFQRFYQEETPGTPINGGTGIGLSLSKELAELMGGSIRVTSEQGVGSSFVLSLPLRDVRTEALPAESVPRETRDVSAEYQRGDQEQRVILVVEDNAELRGFIRQSIGAEWLVVEASNGEEGIRKALDLVPDLVISDVMMPIKDGYAVCDELKNNEITAHIPIILLTAKAGMDSRIKGLRTGADEYLTKPFNTEELLARMHNLLELRRRLREYYQQQLPTGGRVASELPDTLSAPDKEFLRRFMLVLEENLSDETLGVEDFAQKMFVSRVQLLRKLKALTGQSPTDYIRVFRLERAMALLQSREGNIMQVSAQVGFGNEKYFSTVFKEYFGKSPSEV
jgi:signal transduction histidine kinase/DNA-binding response OmpR family regulator/ligand-binding sensor domain-containing protein